MCCRSRVTTGCFILKIDQMEYAVRLSGLLSSWFILDCSFNAAERWLQKLQGRTAYCCLPYWTCCSLLQLAFTVATSCRAGRLTRVCQPLLQRIRYSGHLYDFWLLREDTPHFASLFCCLNSQSHLTVFAELSLLCDMLFIGVAPTLVSSNFLDCSN